MKVVVIGAGVVGLTTAYELGKDGHEVTVVERHDGAAGETSFGNAGLIAPGHSYTWASPSAPRILVKSLFRRDQALRFSPSLDPDLYRWSLSASAPPSAHASTRSTSCGSVATRKSDCTRSSRTPASPTTD